MTHIKSFLPKSLLLAVALSFLLATPSLAAVTYINKECSKADLGVTKIDGDKVNIIACLYDSDTDITGPSTKLHWRSIGGNGQSCAAGKVAVGGPSPITIQSSGYNGDVIQIDCTNLGNSAYWVADYKSYSTIQGCLYRCNNGAWTFMTSVISSIQSTGNGQDH